MEIGVMKIVGRGRTAEIFELDDEKVIKLFYPGFSPKAIAIEVEIGLILNNHAVPAPFLYEKKIINGRKGIIYEYIRGESVISRMLKNPLKLGGYAKKMAKLHYEIHQRKSINLNSQHEYFKNSIISSRDTLGDRMGAILKLLDKMTDHQAICHGDFHPDNILITSNSYIAVDWMNAYSGNPLSDVARTQLMISGPAMPEDTPLIIGLVSGVLKKRICKMYTKEYCRLSGAVAADINEWIPVVAAARIRENIQGEKQWLLSLIDTELSKKS